MSSDRRRTSLLLVVGAATALISIDITIANVALPSIVRELGAEGHQLQWIIDAYALVFACMLLPAGSIGDKFGRKGTLLTGVAILGTGSLFAALSSSATMLIVMRGIQGIGAALIFPTTLSIITNAFSGTERARAIGIWAAAVGSGIAIGPLVGGLLLDNFWWGSVFLLNVPLCAVIVVIGRAVIPDSRDPTGRQLDPFGGLLSVVTVGTLIFGIIQAPDQGWTDPTVLGSFIVAVVAGTLFVFWELRAPHPMLDVRIFHNARFSAASVTMANLSFANNGAIFLLTLYFQFVLGYSPLKTGFMLIPAALGIFLTAPRAHLAVERWGSRIPVTVGAFTCASMLLIYSSDSIMQHASLSIIPRFLYGVGSGLCTAPLTDSIMGSLPREKAGVGSAMNDATRQIGGAMGVAALGSILAARYKATVDGVKVPARAVAGVHDSIGQALEAASRLPARQAALVEVAARHAFLEAMRFTFLICAALLFIGPAIALRFLPARPREEHDSLPAPEVEPPERLGAGDPAAVDVERVPGDPVARG